MANEKMNYKQKQKSMIDNFSNTSVFVHNCNTSNKILKKLQIADIMDNCIRMNLGNGIASSDLDVFHQEYKMLEEHIARVNNVGANILAKSPRQKITNNKIVLKMINNAKQPFKIEPEDSKRQGEIATPINTLNP